MAYFALYKAERVLLLYHHFFGNQFLPAIVADAVAVGNNSHSCIVASLPIAGRVHRVVGFTSNTTMAGCFCRLRKLM
jgi:hypothetical protein